MNSLLLPLFQPVIHTVFETIRLGAHGLEDQVPSEFDFVGRVAIGPFGGLQKVELLGFEGEDVDMAIFPQEL